MAQQYFAQRHALGLTNPDDDDDDHDLNTTLWYVDTTFYHLALIAQVTHILAILCHDHSTRCDAMR